jgi:hypothetical protein
MNLRAEKILLGLDTGNTAIAGSELAQCVPDPCSVIPATSAFYSWEIAVLCSPLRELGHGSIET